MFPTPRKSFLLATGIIDLIGPRFMLNSVRYHRVGGKERVGCFGTFWLCVQNRKHLLRELHSYEYRDKLRAGWIWEIFGPKLSEFALLPFLLALFG